MSLAIQGHFVDGLVDAGRTVPADLTAWSGPSPARRFAVYRNNVRIARIGALASRFPATERIVGTAFFTGMAEAFVALYPPRSPVLIDYGDDLAEFVEGFEPAASLPYLADVIRLEAARGKAYHGADAAPLDPAALAAVPAERLAGLTCSLHPAASVIRSNHPIVTIWAMNAGEAEIEPIGDWRGEDALVARPHLTVLVRHLPSGGGPFLSALARGSTLGDAAATAFEAASDFDLTANLTGMLQAGFVTAIRWVQSIR